jgi:heme/copper-type cytochrome/quinol oxidase subunit 1
MPRRISDYPDAFAGWNLISSLGSIISVIAAWLFIYIVYIQLIERQPTNRYVWYTPEFNTDYLQGKLNRIFPSLEWALSSPPKPHSFTSLPLMSLPWYHWSTRMYIAMHTGDAEERLFQVNMAHATVELKRDMALRKVVKYTIETNNMNTATIVMGQNTTNPVIANNKVELLQIFDMKTRFVANILQHWQSEYIFYESMTRNIEWYISILQG